MSRYTNIPIVRGSNNKLVTRFVLYPNIPFSENDIYVVTTSGDKLENLAYTYYGDVNNAWIIGVANNLGSEGYILPAGLTLRIPSKVSEVLAEYKQINRLQE